MSVLTLLFEQRMDAMAKQKQTVLKELQRVRLIGPALAETLYEEHKIRTLDDLIALAESGELTLLKGVGETKASTMLSSAQRIAKQEKVESSSKAKPAAANEKADAKKKAKADADKKAKAEADKKAKADAEKKTSKGNGKVPPELEKAAAAPTSARGVGPAVEPVTPAEFPKPKVRAKTSPQSLRQRFINVLRCPACGHDSFDSIGTTLTCEACGRQFSLQNGIADLAPPHIPSRSMTQKLMESRFYAQFYEEFMRPRLTGIVSDRSMREEYRLAAEFLDFGDDLRLLDVGCGTANFTRYFAQRIGLAEAAATDPDLPLVVGMDLSWPMLENARRNIRQENLDEKVFLLRGDGTRIPVQRGAFNRIHCAGTLHLMNDIDEGLRNFARVLEPDGVCVIGTFVLGSGALRRLVKRAAEFPTHFHWFSRDELHKRVERAGFEILDDSLAGDAITLKARRI